MLAYGITNKKSGSEIVEELLNDSLDLWLITLKVIKNSAKPLNSQKLYEILTKCCIGQELNTFLLITKSNIEQKEDNIDEGESEEATDSSSLLKVALEQKTKECKLFNTCFIYVNIEYEFVFL